MKRRALIRMIAREALRQGVEWKVHREGANHTIFLLGGTRVPIPRHKEISERLAMAIFIEAEAELGRRWWS
jgi:mRNA interferase HicA